MEENDMGLIIQCAAIVCIITLLVERYGTF
jgi:hypothetical protein